MSLSAYLVMGLTIAVASCLQASIGFGMGMLSAPVLALIDPSVLPELLIMLAALVTLIVAVRERQSLDLHGAGWAMVGRLPGTAIGALLVVVLPERGLALMLASVVLLGVVLNWVGWAPYPDRPNLVAAGAASGLFGTAVAIGGPPMALIWQGRAGAALRGTMSGFFLVGSAVSLAMLLMAGTVDRHSIVSLLLLLPAAALGYVLSLYVNRYLDARRLRFTAIAVSTVGAVILIAQQLVTAL